MQNEEVNATPTDKKLTAVPEEMIDALATVDEPVDDNEEAAE